MSVGWRLLAEGAVQDLSEAKEDERRQLFLRTVN